MWLLSKNIIDTIIVDGCLILLFILIMFFLNTYIMNATGNEYIHDAKVGVPTGVRI